MTKTPRKKHRNDNRNGGGRMPNSIEKTLFFVLGITLLMIWANNFTIEKHMQNNKSISMETGLEEKNVLWKKETKAKKDRQNRPDRRKRRQQKQQQLTKSDYAYTWILGSISDNDLSYRGFLFDILISARALRKYGSTADFWIYTRLSPDSNLTALPTEDEKLLHDLGFKVKELETPKKESFAQLVYDKFLTFGMTDYKRVIFLDADIVPLANMDYLFHLSDPDYKELPTLLKSNLILATNGEPCNTGMFMIQPSSDSFAKYKEVVRKHHEIARELPYPHFSKTYGWGVRFHSLKQHKYWQAAGLKKNRGWTFHAAHSDQGLMYYFTRFILQDVSIVLGNTVQNWGRSKEEGVEDPDIESEKTDVLSPYQEEVPIYTFSCDKPIESFKKEDKEYIQRWRCYPPNTAIAHFSGNKKPWLQRFNFKEINSTWSYRMMGATSFWFKSLHELSEEYDIGVDVKNWNQDHLKHFKKTSLGQMALYTDHMNVVFQNHTDTVKT